MYSELPQPDGELLLSCEQMSPLLAAPSYNLLSHTGLNPQLMNNRTLLREKIFLEKRKRGRDHVKEYQLL